jgi:hypothetical protein
MVLTPKTNQANGKIQRVSSEEGIAEEHPEKKKANESWENRNGIQKLLEGVDEMGESGQGLEAI